MNTCVDLDVSGFAEFLCHWAPTIWYSAAVIGFWSGSGVLVYRSVMRAFASTGRQQLTGDTSNSVSSWANRGDRTIWTFSTPWALLISGVLGPIGAFLLAVTYHYATVAWIERSHKREQEKREKERAMKRR